MEKNEKRKSRFRTFMGILAVTFFAYIVYLANVKETAIPASGSWFMPSRGIGSREIPIYSVETEDNKIALTFDASYGAEEFDSIMTTLDRHKIKVTFFMTGIWVDTYPDQVKTLVKKGHDLGNHGEHHYDMAMLSKDEMKKELMDVHYKVEKLTGYQMFLFRCPYGSYNDELIQTAYACQYYPVQWSVDSLDWKDYGVRSIIDTVCGHRNLKPGAIILCHNGAKYTPQALDTLITDLEEKGYEIVPLSELIYRKDYHLDVTGRQILDN